MKILVVDDNHQIRNLLYRILYGLGHNVEVAADAESGLEILQKFKPDFLISDDMLPGIRGVDLAKKAKGANPNIDIIIISGTLKPEDAPNYTTFIAKPFKIKDITDAIKK